MKENSAKRFTGRMIAIGAVGASVAIVNGQSSDALLNKLVQKGVLTSQEAADLKRESDAGFDKAYRNKSRMPDWVTMLKIYGDLRTRYEFFHTDNDVDGPKAPNKDREVFRFRLRTGMTVSLKDSFEVGFRLVTGEQAGSFGGNPISGNQTAQDNGSKKPVWIDTAYGKWTPIHTGPWMLSGTIGKMDNPFVAEMAFDADYTPEGAALQGSYAINDSHSIKWNGGVFVLDEINQGTQAGNDPLLFGVQLRHDAKWTPDLTSSIGIAWYSISHADNLTNGAVPNIQIGNSRYGKSVPGSTTKVAGALVYDYDPIIADASVTYTLDRVPGYPGKFPIRIGGEYMENPGAKMDNYGYWAGIFFGKASKKGTWELSYRWKHLGADAQYEEFVDSDFSAYYQKTPTSSGMSAGIRAGTGIQGHIIRISYAPSDSFQLGATYLRSELINPPQVGTPAKRSESGAHRLQVDATWKF